MFSLPSELCGLKIRDKGDYRVVVKTLCALTDIELLENGPLGNERVLLALEIFYEDSSKITDLQKAFDEMCKFIACGKEEKSTPKSKRLYDWEQDSLLIAGAISEVSGFPIMECAFLHWWSFMSYFYQIKDGAFASVCSIRAKQNKGKKLEKHEQDFIRENSDMINLKTNITDDEQKFIDDLFSDWG